MGVASKLLTTSWEEWNDPDRLQRLLPIGGGVGAAVGYLVMGSTIAGIAGVVIGGIAMSIYTAATD